MRNTISKIISASITIGALGFCMLAGAAGYKQLYIVNDIKTKSTDTHKAEVAPAQETIPEPKEEPVVIYNISANQATFYNEPAPVPEIILSQEEFDLLTACVEAEAGNQDILGKRLVADVILNRVDSEEFPNSITEVISQPRQFSTFWDGAIAQAEPTDQTYEAVELELAERSYPSVLFFDCNNYLPYGTPWKKVGGHYFSTR